MKSSNIRLRDMTKAFGGVVLTREDYLEVENRYVECAVEIVEASQCKYMTIGYVEDYNGDQLRDVLRAILRNETWCVLVNLKHKVQIDFGWKRKISIGVNMRKCKLRC